MAVHSTVRSNVGARDRYSAKNMAKPVNFFCVAPEAKAVFLVGDFSDWRADAHPMTRQPDGAWHIVVAVHHGHHRYHFLVDGKPVLDPRATGIARNARNEHVSLIAIS